MWIEYFKNIKDENTANTDRKMLNPNNDILEAPWMFLFKLFADNQDIMLVNIYLDWAEPQSAAYVLKEYCRYRCVPCNIRFGEKPDFTNIKIED